MGNDSTIYTQKSSIMGTFFSVNSKSPIYLRELGLDTVSENVDFFKTNLGNIIVTNPPYSKMKPIMERLYELNKPFILILPISKICCQYTKKIQGNIQIMIPKSRKNSNGYIIKQKNQSNFDSCFFGYKIYLQK